MVRTIVLDKKKMAGHWLDLWKQVVGVRWALVIDIRGSALSYLVPAKRRVVYNRSWETGLRKGMEFVVSDDVAADPDELIDAGVRAGLTYREKLTRETSVAVSDAVVRGAELRGKAMHAHRKDIPVVDGEEFARLVGAMESAG